MKEMQMATSRIGWKGRAAVWAAWTLALAAAFLGTAAFGDSYLLAVEESMNGRPSPLPMPIKEGLFDSLFEAGHVVFDTKDGDAVPPFQDLILMARDGGARLVLHVNAASRDSAGPEKRRTIASTVAFELYESKTGRILGRGSISAGNEGREAECDGRQLGMEVGRKIIKDAGVLALVGKAP
jgi:hypothetical protein